MLFQWTNVFVFFALSFLTGFLILGAASLIRPYQPSPEKDQPYECGMKPLGESWVQFDIKFYTIALIFLVFDVEVAFLFPWAVVLDELGAFAFFEMLVFVLILGLGFFYLWRQGDLEWKKS